MTDPLPADLAAAIEFHGHHCPGLTIGYRAALCAMKALGVERSGDEELVAIAENDSCAVDAVQSLTGCTLGKGNLILRDWGKQVLTLGRRSDGRTVRVALRHQERQPEDEADPEASRRRRIERMLSAADDELFDVQFRPDILPEPARIFRSVRCQECGEGVMEARAHLSEGRILCPECYGEPYCRR